MLEGERYNGWLWSRTIFTSKMFKFLFIDFFNIEEMWE